MDVQQLLGELARIVAAELGTTATITTSDPKPTFTTAMVHIRPVVEGAAPIDLWAEGEEIVVCAGDGAMFYFDGESDEELMALVLSFLRDVTQGRFYAKYLGPIYVTSSVVRGPKTRFTRLVYWPAYDARLSSGS